MVGSKRFVSKQKYFCSKILFGGEKYRSIFWRYWIGSGITWAEVFFSGWLMLKFGSSQFLGKKWNWALNGDFISSCQLAAEANRVSHVLMPLRQKHWNYFLIIVSLSARLNCCHFVAITMLLVNCCRGSNSLTSFNSHVASSYVIFKWKWLVG